MIYRKFGLAILTAGLLSTQTSDAQENSRYTTLYQHTTQQTTTPRLYNGSPKPLTLVTEVAFNSMSILFDSLKMNGVPFQISFTPGLSTQGRYSTKIINSFSFNILGGETGGTSGFELGGLFNLNKGYTRGLQIGGLFNLTRDYTQGVQIGGLYNKVGAGVTGLQIAGIHNLVNGDLNGLQVGGIYNHANSGEGLQVAGISNYLNKHMRGIQVAGIANFARAVDGVQVSGIVNRTKKLRGVQIGLINIADTSDGYSIGLINIVPRGYHKLAITTNEVMQVNATLKTGTKQLYSMILAGASAVNHDKVYSFGAGLGKEIAISNLFSLNPEVSAQYVYLGSFRKFNLLNKFNLDLHVNLGKHLSIFGGPSFSAYYKEQHLPVPGYKSTLPAATYHTFRVARNVDGWIGWNAGISFF
ncbi:hypothetical protein EXU57_02965 [Segetibacter sp. 3557_3]|uniref:hypothetical protein n=1 Tax=Segetibacter sp. 3557_3 TaxID=2547429 RepID=UPI001058AD2C|nr:hypothetical protein [Segetibacter sp. 3557_3]TDH29051.1 hypothetical protein EXU57_02965 [Segetibacter sp. 3557_3]